MLYVGPLHATPMRKKWEGGGKATVGEDAMIKILSAQMQSDYLL